MSIPGYVPNNVSLVAQDGTPVTLAAGGDATAANQVSQIAALGAVADAAYAGAGSSSIISALKGLYAKLGAVVLAAGSAVIGKVGIQVGGADVAITNPVNVSRKVSGLTAGYGINFATSGDHTVIPAVAAQTHKVHALVLTAASTVTITFKNGAGAFTGAFTLAAGVPFVLEYMEDPWFTCGTNTDFVINTSGAVQVTGTLKYVTS